MFNDLSNSTVLNDTTIVVNGDTLILPDTDDQTLSISGDTLFIEDGNFVILSDQDNQNLVWLADSSGFYIEKLLKLVEILSF